MPTIKALTPEKIRIATKEKHIPWEDSSTMPKTRNTGQQMLQPRALKAMELAFNIDKEGYNVYLSGQPQLGRSYIVREFITPHARKSQLPQDILYLYNFNDSDKPISVCLPAGQGKVFKKQLQDAIVAMRNELPRHFEGNAYIQGRAKILETFQEGKSSTLKLMNEKAKSKGFGIDVEDGGNVALYPLVEGKRLNEEEFEHLDTEMRQDFKRKADTLMNSMTGHIRQISRLEQELRTEEKSLERSIAVKMLKKILTPMQESFLRKTPCAPLQEYLEVLHADILNNLDNFINRDSFSGQAAAMGQGATAFDMGASAHGEPNMGRYAVNIFVDNSESKGAPIIFEEHPTAGNVLGCIERESEMGNLITDFSLIKCGSLHKAMGGYLVIRIEDILQHFQAWDGLLRALRSGVARMEDLGEGQDSATRTKGIEPAPIYLKGAQSVKVILIGNELLYETLLHSDERFGKLFRIKAHLSEHIERNAQNIKHYLHRINCIIQDDNLPIFHKSALAWMVDYGSKLVEDQRQLSLKFPLLREIMIEAAALALQEKQETGSATAAAVMIDAAILEKALEGKTYRANLVEDVFMEEYDREMIKVRTSGEAIGQVNGLSVTLHGDFEFGLPHQISCTVGVGHGGIIDLEREAELGGPIHTKAMMILKSYLVSLFARKRPIVLTGSLCIEQSYAGIEGDSASGAELVALLSAIAEVPVRLDYAFTGALSQSGQIMAVGGVTRKIEGFFNVCARHGLTGTQGVLIPYDNVEHLMLSSHVVDAVTQGKFFIYPIKHIDEALEILTGIPAGKRRKDDTFNPQSLYGLVDKRLHSLGAYAAKDVKGARRKAGSTA